MFQRHVGCGMHRKSAVAARGFALGTRQCIFFAGIRVQKNRKVFADRQVAQLR